MCPTLNLSGKYTPAWQTDSHTKAGFGRYVCEYDSVVVTPHREVQCEPRLSLGNRCGFVPQADYYVSGETRVLCLPSVREGMQRLLNGIARDCKLRPNNLSASELTRSHSRILRHIHR